MDNSVRINDRIMLRDDIPEHNLRAGQIGRVLEIMPSGELEIDFRDSSYQLIAQVPLNLAQVRVLRHEATLDAAGFWKLIEDAKVRSGGDAKRQGELLVAALSQLSIIDILAFKDLHHNFATLAYRPELWAAATIICAGCSDDGFMDFRDWLIEQGEGVFYKALRDPESLIDKFEVKQEMGIPGFTYGDYELAGASWADREAYELKTGEEQPGFPGIYKPPALVVQERQELPSLGEWEMWDEATCYRKYPKLVAKYQPFYKTEQND